MISKTTNVGADLDRDGFSTWNNISHFGIMRVPVSFKLKLLISYYNVKFKEIVKFSYLLNLNLRYPKLMILSKFNEMEKIPNELSKKE